MHLHNPNPDPETWFTVGTYGSGSGSGSATTDITHRKNKEGRGLRQPGLIMTVCTSTLSHRIWDKKSEHLAHCKDNTENSKQIFPEEELCNQFSHSCVCERFIYLHDRSAYSAAGKYVDRSWEYIIINHLQTQWMRKLGLTPHNSFSGTI